jgi:hypothetical protein
MREWNYAQRVVHRDLGYGQKSGIFTEVGNVRRVGGYSQKSGYSQRSGIFVEGGDISRGGGY